MLDESLDNFVLVDGIPAAEKSKLDRLALVLRKKVYYKRTPPINPMLNKSTFTTKSCADFFSSPIFISTVRFSFFS